MTPTSFKETNLVLGSGGAPNIDQLAVCGCLHPDFPSNHVFLISKWKISPEELQKITETGYIWISIMSTKHPPIIPMAHNPFTEDKFKPIDVHKLL